MKDLLPLGEKIGARLKARKETIVVAESSTGGLVSAALLAVPGASAYFIGGGAFYTRQSFLALRETNEQMFAGKRGCTEDWALMLARTLRDRCQRDLGDRRKRCGRADREPLRRPVGRELGRCRRTRSSAPSRSRRAAATVSPTCARFRPRRSSSSPR